MKEKLNEVLNKLMDLIVPSLIILVGMITVIGFFYSIVVAIKYRNRDTNKTALFNKEKIGYSIVIELLVGVFLFIFTLNYSYLVYINNSLKLLLIIVMFFLIAVLIGGVSVALWLLAEKEVKNLPDLFGKSIYIYTLSIPYWLIYGLIFVITLVITILFPASLILTLGYNIYVINYICEQTTTKYQIELDKNS